MHGEPAGGVDAGAIPDLEGCGAETLLRWALRRFNPRIALASSFGAEDVVLIDMLSRIEPRIRVFTLDTGRLHEETYELMERVRRRYGIDLEVCFPDREAVEDLERIRGLYSFRESLAARKECCRIRKVEPMGRVLGSLDAWVTGLRREQAMTRDGLCQVEPDAPRPGLLKLNPLAGWTTNDVWEYVRRHDVPYNALHDRGFPSIGCAPCTRAVAPGEDLRAGRWWWESSEHKECGLHKA